ncbi:trihelix transcription factor DF1-like isoform X2 [Prosopis cineraria]|uniref:trihelix transcription factor DF1-like isoform X2 n=1 Tax=Prosopis cineraria TaxID=364024 RepID=UPI00240FAC2B|nr:trihelix transcription factor DF1-like isoform X2 [Prosopis cineraria]
MQLGDPSVLETPSGEATMAAPVTATAPPGAAASDGRAEIEMMNNIVCTDATNCGDDIDHQKRSVGGGGQGGNRWPRQETFALLKIRSDMDASFRDSSLKGPLWEQVSRKMAELGYSRSAKKCKEKFENVYKYHKRTKESRSGKPEGKTYKFFDQLQALENRFTVSHTPKPPPPPPQPSFQTWPSNINNDSTATISYDVTTIPSTINPTLISPPPPPLANIGSTTSTNPRNLSNKSLFSSITTTSTSSSTASDEDMEDKYRKKRKMKDYFRRLTRQVLAKQEEMQKRFLEAIEKRERERETQLEAWMAQEMARINREHDLLIQERSTAAAKDAATITFLQKLSGGQQNPAPPHPPAPPQPVMWPKAEVHALIRLRTSMDPKYQENGPKGPLWEDISAGMQRLGYNRSSKRCKEKWENINKYFKKVKESNKQRREDSKTCPYFRELDALYREKSKTNNSILFGAGNPNMMMEPLMVQPEQQWRPPPQHAEEEGGAGRENAKNVVQYEAREREEEEEEEDEMDEDDEVLEDEDRMEDDQERRYEVAATSNKVLSVDTVE